MAPEEHQWSTAVSRRAMLRRIGAGTGVVWGVPVITSFKMPAYAATAGPGGCHLSGSLNAGQEVPPRDSSATGAADMSVDTRTNVVRYMYSFKNLTGAATSAGVHQASVGENGPVAITLAKPPRSGSGAVTGVIVVASVLAADVCANPTNYYINISSTAFAEGEIRGQFAAT